MAVCAHDDVATFANNELAYCRHPSMRSVMLVFACLGIQYALYIHTFDVYYLQEAD